MAYRINEICAACGCCVDVCPTKCIQEGRDKYEIIADLCIDCGACAQECPVGAPEQC